MVNAIKGNTEMEKQIRNYYISTGAKNAMYTLRVAVRGNVHFLDNYICNLAATEEKAIEKATDYVERLQQRVADQESLVIILDDCPEFVADKRRGKLSIYDTRNIEAIESGVFPFGKHKGVKIVDAPDSYVLYFADQALSEANMVSNALIAACQGVALEKGLIAKREAIRAERFAVDSLSSFIGTIGERREFKGEIFAFIEKQETEFQAGYTITKVRIGNDIVSFFNNEMGKMGDTISFKATVKQHNDYKGVKTTIVNRPKAL
jgi:uncharacterized protein (DUF3820 family)